jgi:phospholipase C
LARHFTTLDAYFCSILGPTFPNRLFLHAAQTDRLQNTFSISTLPTIWDRLRDAGVSARYYYSNLPFLALWGATYLPIAAPFERFLADAAAGTLPAVSYIDPRFTLLDGVFANDDHPHADIRAGDAFLSEVFHAVAAGPGWPGTVLIVTYDEWGGFFDHVAPPRATAPNGVDPDLVGGRSLLGLRVPVVVASPFTRGFSLLPRVNHLTFDHTSVLKLIEWRWRLDPLTARDASPDVGNLASALRFGASDSSVPFLPRPLPPWPRACPATAADMSSPRSTEREWDDLLRSAIASGWEVRLW